MVVASSRQHPQNPRPVQCERAPHGTHGRHIGTSGASRSSAVFGGELKRPTWAAARRDSKRHVLSYSPLVGPAQHAPWQHAHPARHGRQHCRIPTSHGPRGVIWSSGGGRFTRGSRGGEGESPLSGARAPYGGARSPTGWSSGASSSIVESAMLLSVTKGPPPLPSCCGQDCLCWGLGGPPGGLWRGHEATAAVAQRETRRNGVRRATV
mmetsp:Transcript_20465/g.53244  ORF Transcript_20465/g.53244 Transcript_20465/m.53244 type:complete len:209 (-) Transcript_20465:180-806(-)